MEELQVELRQRFSKGPSGFSSSTILRILKFKLLLTRKVLERRAREAVLIYKAKMRTWYSYPDQLVFLNETSKSCADSMRRYA